MKRPIAELERANNSLITILVIDGKVTNIDKTTAVQLIFIHYFY